MLLEGQEDREKRFKAMLQYLILREACEFEGNNPVNEVDENKTRDGTELLSGTDEKKAYHVSESAKKILKEMESKFFNLFVEDDLVENYLFFGAPYKIDAINQKDQFKNQIQDQILEKIKFINSTDIADTREARKHNKELLEKIVRSPIIENSIMTCCLSTEFKESYLISDINNVFNLSNLVIIEDNALVRIRNEFLSEQENACCKIKENSIAIQAHLNTATSLSLGFLNLTGKIIAKALGDLSGVLSVKDINSDTSPSESVRGEKISKILASLPIHDNV